VVAYDERGGVGWILAAVDGIAPGVRAERAVIVTPDYFVEELRWHAGSEVRFELPFHFDAAADISFAAATLDGGSGAEDGFAFATDARRASVAKQTAVHFRQTSGDHTARAWVRSEPDTTWYEAAGPGQPANTARRFFVARTRGTSGMMRSVWTWTPRVDRVSFSDEAVTVELGTEKHVHRRTDEYWSMEMTVGGAQSGIELYGWRKAHPSSAELPAELPPSDPIVVRDGVPLTIQLGEEHYRRSEESWRDAGRPTASLMFEIRGDLIDLTVRVPSADIVFVDRDATNPFDNEHPDVNGHGVLVYLSADGGGGAWSVAPEHDSARARVRALTEWGALAPTRADWSRTSEGFEIRLAFPAAGVSAIDVIVNDVVPHRARRRGQLVLSGGRGEFVYLRGDRHDSSRLIPLRIL
jgi:hypothetical protein